MLALMIDNAKSDVALIVLGDSVHVVCFIVAIYRLYHIKDVN